MYEMDWPIPRPNFTWQYQFRLFDNYQHFLRLNHDKNFKQYFRISIMLSTFSCQLFHNLRYLTTTEFQFWSQFVLNIETSMPSLNTFLNMDCSEVAMDVKTTGNIIQGEGKGRIMIYHQVLITIESTIVF